MAVALSVKKFLAEFDKIHEKIVLIEEDQSVLDEILRIFPNILLLKGMPLEKKFSEKQESRGQKPCWLLLRATKKMSISF